MILNESLVKSYKDENHELSLKHNDSTRLYSVGLKKNDKLSEFQNNLDFETALEIYDFYWDKIMGNDLTSWEGLKINGY